MNLKHDHAKPDKSLSDHIEELAAKSTEGTLTADERDEYAGYVRANKSMATLRRQAQKQSELEA